VAGKTRLRNDLRVYVEWDVKLYSLTHATTVTKPLSEVSRFGTHRRLIAREVLHLLCGGLCSATLEDHSLHTCALISSGPRTSASVASDSGLSYYLFASSMNAGRSQLVRINQCRRRAPMLRAGRAIGASLANLLHPSVDARELYHSLTGAMIMVLRLHNGQGTALHRRGQFVHCCFTRSRVAYDRPTPFYVQFQDYAHPLT